MCTHFRGTEIQENKSGLDRVHKLQLSTPFLPFASGWRFNLHLAFLHLIPIRTQSCSAAFLVAFHHRSFRVFIRVSEYLLEEAVKSGVATHIRVLVRGLLLFRTQDVCCNSLPVFLRFPLGRGSGSGGAWE